MGADTTGDLRTVARTAQVVSGALLGAVAVYAGVGLFLAGTGAMSWSRPGWTRPEAATLLTNVFLCVAGGAAALAAALGRILLAGGPGAGSPQERAAAYARRFLTASIVRAALGESIAVLGFVLFLLYGDRTALLGFSAAAAGVIAAFRPSWEKLREGARRVAPELPGL